MVIPHTLAQHPRPVFQLSSCLTLGDILHSLTCSISTLIIHLPIFNHILACMPFSLSVPAYIESYTEVEEMNLFIL